MKGNFVRKATEQDSRDIMALINNVASHLGPMRAAAMQIGDTSLDAKLITALATLAGAITGEMFGIGAIGEDDIAATREIVGKSFDNGIGAGKAKVARAIAEEQAKAGDRPS